MNVLHLSPMRQRTDASDNVSLEIVAAAARLIPLLAECGLNPARVAQPASVRLFFCAYCINAESSGRTFPHAIGSRQTFSNAQDEEPVVPVIHNHDFSCANQKTHFFADLTGRAMGRYAQKVILCSPGSSVEADTRSALVVVLRESADVQRPTVSDHRCPLRYSMG
jgi:hypothetical protein